MNMNAIEAIQIGGLSLTRYTENLPGWEGKIWIEQADGEGGAFDVSEVEKVIAKFYEENF